MKPSPKKTEKTKDFLFSNTASSDPKFVEIFKSCPQWLQSYVLQEAATKAPIPKKNSPNGTKPPAYEVTEALLKDALGKLVWDFNGDFKKMKNHYFDTFLATTVQEKVKIVGDTPLATQNSKGENQSPKQKSPKPKTKPPKNQGPEL